jgi:hypothetical protein
MDSLLIIQQQGVHQDLKGKGVAPIVGKMMLLLIHYQEKPQWEW